MQRLVLRAPFEIAVGVFATLYVFFHLSGSSYALALQVLGADETPLLGTPRDVRTEAGVSSTRRRVRG
jgi:hypothetical protein